MKDLEPHAFKPVPEHLRLERLREKTLGEYTDLIQRLDAVLERWKTDAFPKLQEAKQRAVAAHDEHALEILDKKEEAFAVLHRIDAQLRENRKIVIAAQTEEVRHIIEDFRAQLTTDAMQTAIQTLIDVLELPLEAIEQSKDTAH